mgnify:CR=1 FL=1
MLIHNGANAVRVKRSKKRAANVRPGRDRDGYLYGPWRTPRNQGRATTGNIHSDDSAQKLGFRGGLVAGSIHMEMFVPHLLRLFGERCYQRGSLSLYFLYATLDGEAVRAVLQLPPEGATDAQITVWGERPDGTRICEGTASVGDVAEPSALHARELVRYEPGELRILAGVKAGDELPAVDTRVEQEALERRLEVITEPLPYYTDPSRFGGLVATPVNVVNAMIQPAYRYLARDRQNAIGMYGAIELRYINGPLLVETSYQAGGTVLGAGQSPKTEYLWFDTYANDARGARVAEMRMLLRYVKTSSPLYGEVKAAASAEN